MRNATASRYALGIIAGLTLVVLLAGTVAAEDWPWWRGPTSDGISAEKDWSPEAVAAGKVLWRANVGKGHASFAVAGGKVYTMGNAGNKDTVYCFDAETGKEVWKQTYDCPAGNYPGPRGTPTVDGKFVYSMSREGHLLCMDSASGKVKWRKKVPSGLPRWGISTSPIIHGKFLLLNAGTSGVAYDKKSGKRAWTGGDGTPGYASPVIMKLGGTECALIFSAKSLICVNAKSGRPRWSFPWVTKYDVNAGDPVVIGKDRVFISSGYNHGCAMLKVSSKGAKALWQNTAMRNHMASTIHHEGALYGFDDGTLACLDSKSSATKWTQGGFGKGALMLADGKLIFLSERGVDLVIAEATPKGYVELAKTRVFSGHTWTAPVLANGRIYCRNDAGDIACVDAKGR
jgi:outer membrane protein assembly factor BamB